MNITQIKNQKLSSLLCDHRICKFCHVVDRERSRTLYGYKCEICSTPSEGGQLHFNLNIHTLVNLIQEAYHAPGNGRSIDTYNTGRDSHNISVVLFFCTLRESLLDGFVINMCVARDIKADIYDRLVSDNRLHSQKQNRLFPSLTGDKWKEAVNKIDANSTVEYGKLDEFVVSAVRERNKFVHEGSKYGMTELLAESCLNNIYNITSFYACLHNKYIHPIYLEKVNSDKS